MATLTASVSPTCTADTSSSSCTLSDAPSQVWIVDGNITHVFAISGGSINIGSNVYTSKNAYITFDTGGTKSGTGYNVFLAGSYTVNAGSCSYNSISQSCNINDYSVSIDVDIFLESVSISPSAMKWITTAQSISFTSTLGSGGSGNYNYQWYANGKEISGATSSSLSFGTSVEGIYDIYLEVYDTSYGHTTISNATRVSVVSEFSGNITHSTTKLDIGQPLELNVICNGGTGNFSYQWQSPSGTNISGATGNVLLYYTTAEGTATFACVVEDEGLSTPISKTISDTNTYYFYSPLDIKISPARAIVKAGGTVDITATFVGGSGNYSYVFYDNGTQATNGTASGSGVSITYAFSSTNAIAHNIYCQLTDEDTNAVRVSAICLVDVVGGISVSITPSNQNVFTGDSATLTASVSGGSGNYSYQWNRNTTNTYDSANDISGGTGITFSQSYAKGDAGTTYFYWVEVKDKVTGVSVVSSSATVNVWNKMSVSISASKTSVMVGESVSFTITASGGSNNSANYSYDWFVNNSSVSTSSSYSISESSAGAYDVFAQVKDSVTNSLGESNHITIVFYAGMSASATISRGNGIVGEYFTVGVNVSGGSGGYSYQWYSALSGGTYSAGATSQSWTLKENSAGTYDFYCVVKDSAGHSATSNTVSIDISTNMIVKVVADTDLVSQNEDDTITATVYNAVGTVSYTWYVNGTKETATGTTYVFSSGTKGVYTISCTATADNGSASGSVNVRVATIVSMTLSDSVSITDVNVGTSVAYGGNFVSNTGSIVSSDKFVVRVNGDKINAWDIYCVKEINMAGVLEFKVPKGVSIKLGDKAEFGYKGNQSFFGYVREIDKSSEYWYVVKAYDGIYDLAGVYYAQNNGVLGRDVGMSITKMIEYFSTQANVGNGISGDVISQPVGVNFGNEAVFGKLLQLAGAYKYNIVMDNLNSIKLMDFSGATVVDISENDNNVIVSKKYNAKYKYGTVKVFAEVNGKTYSAMSGTGKNIRTMGKGWLILNSADISNGVLETMAQNMEDMYGGGQWVVRMKTAKWYDIAGNNVYNISFADGSSLGGLILTRIEISKNGVEAVFSSYSDVVLGLLETMLE